MSQFEKKLSNYLRYKHVVALNSCTAGLHLALAAKEFSKGDKFLAPVLTFVSTIECGEYLGMSPVLVDCKKNGFLIPPQHHHAPPHLQAVVQSNVGIRVARILCSLSTLRFQNMQDSVRN